MMGHNSRTEGQGQLAEGQGHPGTLSPAAMRQQHTLGLSPFPRLEQLPMQGSVSAPISPNSPSHFCPAGLTWGHRASSVPSQVPGPGEAAERQAVDSPTGSPAAHSAHASTHSHIPNIVIDQVSARDAFGHSRTPPFVSSSWSSPWQLNIPGRKVRTNSDSALYDADRELIRPRPIQSPLALHSAHSVSSVSEAIHLEHIRITDSPLFSPGEFSQMTLKSSSSSSSTYQPSQEALKSSVATQGEAVAMETSTSPPKAPANPISGSIDLPESKLQATGSLFQRRHPVPMEVGDNGNNGSKTKPTISIETSDNKKDDELESSHELSSSDLQRKSDSNLLQVTQGDEKQTVPFLWKFHGEKHSEQVHSPKTAWLRRHSDSNLPVEQKGLHVSQDAQLRSHSTGENIKSSISEVVEDSLPSPLSGSQRSTEGSDWSSKRIKVKQYLAKRYELDLESPSRRFSIESSDDVFSPSPGLFSKSKAFSFSPEREAQEKSGEKSEERGAVSKPVDLSTTPLSSQRQRKIPREPLYIRTDERSESLSSAADIEEVETPVFLSPAPFSPRTSSSSPYHGTVFQFHPPQRSGSVERTQFTISPLAASESKERSPSHLPRHSVSPTHLLSHSKSKSPTHSLSHSQSKSPTHSQMQKAHSFPSHFIGYSNIPETESRDKSATSDRVHQSEAASQTRDISSSQSGNVPFQFSPQQSQSLGSSLGVTVEAQQTMGALESRSRERSPIGSPGSRDTREHRQLPLSPREPLMPTIREHSQPIEISPRKGSDVRAESFMQQGPLSRSFPPSPTAGSMEAYPGAPMPSLLPLSSMLRHPSFSHSQMAHAPPPQTPFQSYVSPGPAVPPTGLPEVMQWSGADPGAQAGAAGGYSLARPLPTRSTPPKQTSEAAPQSGSKKTEEGGGGGGGGGGKGPDASKIIYCPFSEEVKQQRYQQDPNQNFVCPVCGQMFPSFNYLANHMVNHLPSETITKGPGEGNKIHICKVCNKSFSRSDMLTRHMRLHTGLRPYECRICGQVFSRSDHLHTHNRTHTGEKPYRCPQCPYAAPRRDMITRHMRIHLKQYPKRGRRSSSTGSSDTQQSSSFSSQESGDSEARRQSHSLSSMDSLESPGVDVPPYRVSLSALEHSSLDIDTSGKQRQWSLASAESYEASDERTPSTPGSAKRFFTHHWQVPGKSGSSSLDTTMAAGEVPSSPKKRQLSMRSDTSEDSYGFYSRDVTLRGIPKYSTESTDTERTLESVSSIGESSQSGDVGTDLPPSVPKCDVKSETELLRSDSGSMRSEGRKSSGSDSRVSPPREKTDSGRVGEGPGIDVRQLESST